jgi:hypothetical protein
VHEHCIVLGDGKVMEPECTSTHKTNTHISHESVIAVAQNMAYVEPLHAWPSTADSPIRPYNGTLHSATKLGLPGCLCYFASENSCGCQHPANPCKETHMDGKDTSMGKCLHTTQEQQTRYGVKPPPKPRLVCTKAGLLVIIALPEAHTYSPSGGYCHIH